MSVKAIFTANDGTEYVEQRGGVWKRAWERPNLSDFTDKPWGDLSADERKRVAGHFAYAPADAATFDELKLPYKDPDGKVNPAGIRAALAVLGGARGGVRGIPEGAQNRIRSMLRGLLGESKK